MDIGKLLGDILIISVFVELLITLTLYIAKTVYDYYKSMRKPDGKPETKDNE